MDMLSVVLFAAVAGIIYSQELVILNPEKAEVLEGGSVLLTCLRESERLRPLSRWTWTSSYGQYFKIYSDYHLEDCLHVSGLENNSLYAVYCKVSSTSIRIHNITKTRHGERWDCMYEVYSSNSALIYVTVPVTSVQIDATENIISTKENTLMHLSCQTSFARPAPNITWYLTGKISERKGTIQLLDYIIKQQITNSTDELFSTKSEVMVRVNRSFDGRHIYCLANNYPGATASSEKILFDVQNIANVISFVVNGFEGKDIITVVENDTVQFTCLIDAVASNAKLMFHWKTVLFEESDTSNLTYFLHQVSCRDSGDYTCVGRNTFNHGEPSIGHLTLLVKCPPRVRPNTVIQENVLAKPDDIVTISLDIIAYPEPRLSDFVWMKLINGNWTIINNSLHKEISIRGLQTNLTIKSVTEEDYGMYHLTVTNELGSYSQNFYLKKADTDERANTNVIAIAIGSVVGIAVLIGIIGVAIFLTRNANQKREFPCISIITKWKGGKKISSIWKTSSSAAAESTANPSSSKPKNIYEQIQRNGEERKEYQEIQFGEDDKCVYKNMQLRPPPASS